MIYFPFAFFGIYLILQYKKSGISLGIYIIALYAMISLFSILMDRMGLIPPEKEEISIFTGILYCILLFLIIRPFCSSKINNIKKIVINKPRVLNGLTYFFFGYFLFTLFAYWDELLWIISYGDFGELRAMIRNGDSLVSTKFSGLFGHLVTLINVFGSVSFIMFPIFFISICFMNKPWWFSLIAFLGTTTVILTGILGCDRSSTFRWFILLCANIIFFWKYLSVRAKARILPLIVSTCIVVSGYFISVTIDRFSESSSGTEGGVVSYGGQSYINFCYLYDHFDNREGFSTYYFFPAIHRWVLKDYEGNVPRQQELTSKTGIECGIFYTVLGSFILDGNQLGPFVFVLIFSLLCQFSLHKIRGPVVTFSSFLFIYILIVIPIFGIIAYPYTSGYHSISFFVLYLLLKK